MTCARLPRRLLVVWGLFILYGTTIPFDLAPSVEVARSGWAAAHKIPWQDPQGGLPSIPDAVANVLLFLPWGFLMGLVRAARGRGALDGLVVGAISALTLSLTVEFLQLFSSLRTTSATDLVTNTTGGLLGAAVGWWTAEPFRRRVEPWFDATLVARPWVLLAGGCVLGVWLHAASPFDVSLDVGDLKSSIKSLRPIPFGPPLRGETPDQPWHRHAPVLVAWALLGGMFAIAAARERRPAVFFAVTFAIVVASVGEGIQLLLRSRVTDATTILLAAVGAGVGASLAFRLPETSRLRAALIGWLVAMLIAGLSPWSFRSPSEGEFEAWRLLPFVYYFLRTDVYALADAIESLLLYLPLGVLLRLADPGVPGLRVVALGGLVGLAVEVCQVFLPRTPDVTDVALGALGAGLGAWLVGWARARTAAAPAA